MTTPTVPDPRVDVLLSEVAVIRRQLDSLGRALGVDPVAVRAAPAPAATPPSATSPAATPPAPTVTAAPASRTDVFVPRTEVPAAPAAAAVPEGAAGAVEAGAPAMPAATRRRPAFVFTPARVLAAGGAVVTILGVGFLLAVAMAAGLFGQGARVFTLSLLAGGLAVAARRLHRRSPEASVALAATSTAASFGVVVAMTTVYWWLSPLAGVVLALAVTTAGILVAHRWRHQLLAALVHLQILLVLPMILSPFGDVSRVQLVIFTVIAYLPTVAAVLTHRWLPLFRFASATVLVVAIGALAGVVFSEPGTSVRAVALAVSFVAVGLVLTLACLLEEAGVAALAVLGAALATVVLRVEVDTRDLPRVDVAVAVGVAAALGLLARRHTDRLHAVLAVGAGVHVLLATVTLPVDEQIVVILIAVEAVAMLMTARATGSRTLWWASLAFTGLTLIGLARLVSPVAILATGATNTAGRWEGIVVGLLVAVAGVLQARWARRLDPGVLDAENHSLAGLALAVYGLSSAIVTVGILPGTSGLVAMGANVLTTIVWVGCAIAMLRRPSTRIVRAGYVVLAVAVGKLFLADLHTVDGILRALLFVLTGLGLIGAATQIRRTGEQQVDDASSERTPETAGTARG